MVTRAERMEKVRRLMRDSVMSMGVAFSEDVETSEAPAELSLFHARWLDYVDGGELAPLREAFIRWRVAVIEAHRNDGMLFGVR
jgi:hypothetical protein